MAEQQVEVREPVVEWFNLILRRKRWTATDLARNAGISPSTILRLMNDPKHHFAPSMRTLTKISDASGLPIPTTVLNAIGARAEAEPTNLPPKPGHVELRYFSSLPASLRAVGTEASRTVPAPAQLREDSTLFAFEMFSDDLEPAFKSGSLMFATKRRDPVRGDAVLISDRAGRTKIRFLVDISEAGMALSKSIPMKAEERVQFEEIGDLAILTGFISKT